MWYSNSSFFNYFKFLLLILFLCFLKYEKHFEKNNTWESRKFPNSTAVSSFPEMNDKKINVENMLQFISKEIGKKT